MASPQIQALIDMMNNTEFTFEDFKASQALTLPALKQQDLSGKNVIVTGANAGLGYEISKSIASMNPSTLILACRNKEKATQAVENITKATGFSNIVIEELDLSSFASVKAFSNRILAKGIAIDILVSNAGIAAHDGWVVTKDGYEIQLQVNHLSNVLLVLSLIPALRKAAHPRVEIVASSTHFWASRPDPSDPHPVQTLNQQPSHPGQYPCTKLMNVLFAREFARRFPDIFVCSSNPGYCFSELGVKNVETGSDVRIELRKSQFLGLELRDTYEGAKTLIDVAINPEITNSGGYFSDMKEEPGRSTTHGETGKLFAQNVWNDTIYLLRKVADNNFLHEK
jgi:NAD(P)-dependent dehydrogenase (short-subunit alcohol dehydrogenase family)